MVGYICLDTADEWDVPLQMAAEKDDDGTLSLKMTDASKLSALLCAYSCFWTDRFGNPVANKYGALAHESFLLELGAKGLHPVHFKIVY